MSEMSTAILVRGVERLAAVAASIFVTWLGFKLFELGASMDQATLKSELPFFHLVLSGTAPGLFFLAFGSFGLLVSLTSKLTINIHEQASDQVGRVVDFQPWKLPSVGGFIPWWDRSARQESALLGTEPKTRGVEIRLDPDKDKYL